MFRNPEYSRGGDGGGVACGGGGVAVIVFLSDVISNLPP